MNSRGGYYTAANTHPAQPFGFVFHRCSLTGACEPGQGFLGRPWRKHAATVFLECEMDGHVAPEGFRDWDADRVVTERFGEWRTSGVRADLSVRHPAEKRITDEEAMLITLPQVLGGTDGWRPDRRIPTWFLCGDSIMADYPPEQAPMTGWGQVLRPFIDEEVHIQNEAVCGRSSRSFIDEKRLEHISLCIREGDRMLIGFGHNDEKAEDPSRFTSPDHTFPEYLSRFIDTALEHGAVPVLATPVVRRRFDENGSPVPTHGSYPDAIRSLARRRGVALADLEKATSEMLREAGEEKSRRLYCHVPEGHPNYPEGLEDNSHLSLTGAVRIARLFLSLYDSRA
jgi:lysophospholipase L1-like esterase